MQPSPPKTEERIEKLQRNPRLWVWFLCAACGVVLGERLLIWVMALFNSPAKFGLDLPTIISLAGTLYAIAAWLVGKIQGVLAVVEALNDRLASAEKGLAEAETKMEELQVVIDEHHIKIEYHEVRIDYNDARVSGIERDRR